MLRAVLLVSRWIAVAHDRLRAARARRRPLSAQLDVLHEKVRRLEEQNELLRARLRRLPHRHRPRYRPWERLAILWHQARYGLSLRATARAFVLSLQTVVNWHRDASDGTGHLVQSKPPVNRLPDVVADLARRLKREWPRWGTRRIAGILARLGIKASRTTVQRMLRRPRRRALPIRAVRARRGPLVAKRPNHMWLVDFTRLGGPFRSVWVGAVIDAFSRRVLSIGVAARGPTSLLVLRLLRQAIHDFGSPTWLISDHGPEMTSNLVGRFLKRHRIRRRYGAIGRTGSQALIDRFFRTLKVEYARGLFLYRPIHAIKRDLERFAAWFNDHRVHQGIDQRTPDEAHSGRSTCATAVPLHALLEVRGLDGDRRLPILQLRPAA